MTQSQPDLTALIGSRICHDLISPVGAISNGMELIEMTMGRESPELSLIQQSVDNASARIRFFRIAFGLAGEEQEIGHSEVAGILKAYYAPTRLTPVWQPTVSCNRMTVKLLFLCMLCCETAMPYGGTIRVMKTDDIWTVQGEGEKMRLDAKLWERLKTGEMDGLAAAQVHFAIAHQVAKYLVRSLTHQVSETRISLSF